GVCTYTLVGTEFDATFTDNCTNGIISNDLNGSTTIANEVLSLGVTVVVWTVDDGNGQTVTCTTIITVEDNVVPVIACPVDIAVNTDLGQCSTVIAFPDAIALDNCGIDTVVQTAGLPSGSPFPVGVNTVEYTATDSSGNTAVCSFTITVTDNELAMAVCQDITIQLDTNGDATIVAADADGGSTDNCSVASITIDIETFTCADVGPNDVTLTVTDVNGNVSNCIAVVTVEDVTMPVVVCMDITVQLDATGTITIIGNDVDNGSGDACGIASYDLDINTFDCSNVGQNNVVLMVTDASGNTATCTAVVTVEDVTMPELECMDITLELDANGTAIITTVDVLASIDDACGINTTSVDIQNFDCSDIGTPVTVTVFAMDDNGNLASCTAVVTVIDALAPVVTCPADQTVDPGQGNLFYEVPDYFATGEATALDNCTDPLTIFSQDPAVGTLLSDGTYTITMSAMDEYGNIGTCMFELMVESILGVDAIELNLGSIVMYPNPAQDFVILSNPQSIALQQATIYDLTGRVIMDVSLENMGVKKQINFSNLSSAIYLVVIESDHGRIIKRIVKE
ncbi:MAG: HYR domain-containing protein, partial [Flavobacteriaceae bacterium]